VAAGCGLKADGGKDPITVVEKGTVLVTQSTVPPSCVLITVCVDCLTPLRVVDELLADTVGSTANGASKLLCLPHKHKERANRAKLAVVVGVFFAAGLKCVALTVPGCCI